MASFYFDNVKICGIASAVPTKVLRSTDYYDKFGKESVDKFVELTGVKEHRESGEHQTASDLGFVAAEKLLEVKQIAKEDIGILIFGTHSTDYRRPASACVLHKRLGLTKECASFDVSLGCSAFVYCAQIAACMLQGTRHRYALVIVGETMTKIVHPDDKSSAMLFGDGGSAILIERTETASIISGELCSDGTGYRAIIVPAGGFRNLNDTHEAFTWQDGNTRTLYNTYMNGADVFSFTITKVPRTVKEYLQETNQDINDFDCLAFHQANQYIHQQLVKKLKVSMDKMPLCLDRYGNTSAPAIPILLSDVYGSEKNDRIINVLMCGFGVGLSWGVMAAQINTSDIMPIIETDDYFEEGIIHKPEDIKK